MKIIPNQSLSFKSRIKFVTNEEYKQLPVDWLRGSAYIDEPYELYQTIRAKDAATEWIRTCTTGGVTKPLEEPVNRDVVLSHVNCDRYIPTKDEIKERIQRKLTTEENLGGLVIGAFVGEPNSRQLAGNMMDALGDLNVDYSVIVGQNGGISNVLYSSNNDTWYVNKKKTTTGSQEVVTLPEVKKAYQFIHLAPKDTLVVKDNNNQDVEYKASELSGMIDKPENIRRRLSEFRCF